MQFSAIWRSLIASTCTVLAAAAITTTAQRPSNAAADPNASTAVQNELNYITSVRNQGLVISGQTIANPWLEDDMEPNPPNDYMSEITRVNEMTGKFPALIGMDFLNFNDYPDHGASIISLAESYAGRGGLIEFQWHEGNPNSADPDALSFYVGGSGEPAPLSSADWNNLLNVPNSTLHQNWLNHMNLLAGWLGQLQSAGVTVLWRPLHEGDGNWFWWGGSPGNYQALYQMEFNYLTGVGLHNLIWVLATPNANYYPGQNYVDIVGGDIYSSNNLDPTYANVNNTVLSFDNGKATALTECGLLPDTNYIHQLQYAYVDVWGGPYLDPTYYPTGSGGDFNTLQSVQNFYGDSRTITLGQVNIPTGPPPPPAQTLADGVYEITGTTTGNVLDCTGCSNADGTPIDLWTPWGGNCQQWAVSMTTSGVYSIRNINPDGSVGKSLDCSGCSPNNGTQMDLWDYWGGPCQQWQINGQGGGNYSIATNNPNSSGTFDVLDGTACSGATGTRVQLWSWDGGGCQQEWSFLPIQPAALVSGDYYTLTNVAANLNLDDPNGTNVWATKLQLFTGNGASAQNWLLTKQADGSYTLTNQAAGLDLDDPNGLGQGTQQQLWPGDGTTAQEWQIDATANGAFTLTNVATGLNLDDPDGISANGQPLQLWPSNGATAQQWRLTPQ